MPNRSSRNSSQETGFFRLSPRLGRSVQSMALTLAVSMTSLFAFADTETPAADGEAVFNAHCLRCHGGWTPDFAYPIEFLQGLQAHFIHATLSEGAMRRQGDAMTAEERQAVAEYLSGGSIDTPPPEVAPACSDTSISSPNSHPNPSLQYGNSELTSPISVGRLARNRKSAKYEAGQTPEIAY